MSLLTGLAKFGTIEFEGMLGLLTVLGPTRGGGGILYDISVGLLYAITKNLALL